MSDLTACYFCGTALDAPVERYPLTPPSIDATTGRSVALCPTCRRKLVQVLEIVGEEFDAVTDDVATEPETADADTADETAEADRNDETAEADTDDESAVGDDETPATDSAETAAARATDGEPEDETPSKETDDESADTADDEDGSGESPAAEIETSASDDAVEDGPAAGTGAEPLAESGSDDVIDDGADDDETPTDSAEMGAPTDDGAGVDDGHAEILSTPAAQKVIKLLQNREFPLEREEFEIVASNAYDIPMRDCEEVIDTLVAEGYVDEDGAMLTRPA